jgi:hypothetical protein
MPFDFAALREGLRAMPASPSQHSDSAPSPEEIFFPLSHASALDPQRTLVVGNRGVGKSFWAHALAQNETRALIANAYERFSEGDRAVFGFHGADAEAIAPSKELLAKARLPGISEEVIWRAVLVRALGSQFPAPVPENFVALVKWCESETELQQRALREVDNALLRRGEKLILVFDALDKLGDNWSDIRPLTVGLLRLALAAKSYRAIKIKIFMRPDQAQSKELFSFPDASKLYNERVTLKWSVSDLYGLLFFELLRQTESSSAMLSLLQLYQHYPTQTNGRIRLPQQLTSDEIYQKRVFDKIAGQFMGNDATRGKTYSWVPLHLADANDETTPRVFLKALREAAYHDPAPLDRAIDHLGIKVGVQKASEARLLELQEDYPWVGLALQPLKGCEVPADPRTFRSLWKKHGTASEIKAGQRKRQWLAPLEMETADLLDRDQETALMTTLQEIGVLELRSNGKVNVPDIFRVEAGIKRRGGVKLPRRK